MIIQKRSAFLGFECSNLKIDEWVINSRNPNFARMCKSGQKVDAPGGKGQTCKI